MLFEVFEATVWSSASVSGGSQRSCLRCRERRCSGHPVSMLTSGKNDRIVLYSHNTFGVAARNTGRNWRSAEKARAIQRGVPRNSNRRFLVEPRKQAATVSVGQWTAWVPGHIAAATSAPGKRPVLNAIETPRAGRRPMLVRVRHVLWHEKNLLEKRGREACKLGNRDFRWNPERI